MELFSNFCNICYKTNDGSLKDISEENVKYLEDTLITFVGHADIIKQNVIFLCQLCCEELTRSHKFREICRSNLIQLRQRNLDIKLKLALQDHTYARANSLKMFVHGEVLQGNTLSEVSIITSVAECDEAQVAFTNEEDSNKKMLTRSEDIKSEKFESELEDIYGFDIENGNESDIVQMEFVKEELDFKNEVQINDSKDFPLNIFENKSAEQVNVDVKMPVINSGEGIVNLGIEYTKKEFHMKQEKSSEDMKLETIADEFGDGVNVTFDIGNDRTIMNMQEPGHRDVSSEDATVGRNLSRGYNNTLTNAIMKTRPNKPHMQAHRNGRSATALQPAEDKRINSDTESNICTVCRKAFSTINYLTRHERSCKLYKCTHCNRAFTQTSTLIIHERIHNGKKPFKCTVCMRAFTQSGHLTAHKRTHSGERPYKCTVCSKPFRNLSDLTTHERIHSGDRPYKCTVCSKTFRASGDLIKHKRIHNGEKPFKCTVCMRAFTQSGHLTAHKRTHTGERPYKCTVCSKAFRNSSDLTTHKRIHSGDRPYKCTVCNKSFIISGELIKHKRTHSGEKPYKCTRCDRAFTQSSNLTRHERTHSSDRPYKCTVCKKSFRSSCYLMVHKRIHNGEKPFKCTVCMRAFTQSSHLTAHKRTHSGERPYKGSVCSKAFRNSGNMTTHERIHSGDRPYKCTVCIKSFRNSCDLMAHKRIHSGEKPEEFAKNAEMLRNNNLKLSQKVLTPCAEVY